MVGLDQTGVDLDWWRAPFVEASCRLRQCPVKRGDHGKRQYTDQLHTFGVEERLAAWFAFFIGDKFIALTLEKVKQWAAWGSRK